MKLHVAYFAILREQRGLGAEELETFAADARSLYAELRRRHHFSLPAERIRVALDDEFASWETPLREGQRVAFLPPVAGG
jgi:molybdopterin synthase sulfur carrier subunit